MPSKIRSTAPIEETTVADAQVLGPVRNQAPSHQAKLSVPGQDENRRNGLGSRYRSVTVNCVRFRLRWANP